MVHSGRDAVYLLPRRVPPQVGYTILIDCSQNYWHLRTLRNVAATLVTLPYITPSSTTSRIP